MRLNKINSIKKRNHTIQSNVNSHTKWIKNETNGAINRNMVGKTKPPCPDASNIQSQNIAHSYRSYCCCCCSFGFPIGTNGLYFFFQFYFWSSCYLLSMGFWWFVCDKVKKTFYHVFFSLFFARSFHPFLSICNNKLNASTNNLV